MAKLFKRRNFFINKNFQGKLIFAAFLLVSGGCLFFIFLFALFSADTLTLSYSNHDLQLGQTPVMLLKMPWPPIGYLSSSARSSWWGR